ncbi:hypothetical protein IMZ08_21045 [Bacillus luteolus]|uniref:Uncharacterized protein n=1 Tax=Litchfieldia luteola TaxID=682179 RepID=A0ABR9QPV2_9BACI|nr:hypothetical protein [Cytobacillus luteolus]MBE4910528.1 hypothetical protein [Cytobacillus luteolus]MBP1943705.1 hypothetical protein [Cytobacillus luteolus]
MGANHKNNNGLEHETSRVGTWISLGVLAAVLLGTYLLFFGVYFDRL